MRADVAKHEESRRVERYLAGRKRAYVESVDASTSNPICLAIFRRDQRRHAESSSLDRLAALSSHGHRTRAKLVIEAMSTSRHDTFKELVDVRAE
jgi:hypothetical protein